MLLGVFLLLLLLCVSCVISTSSLDYKNGSYETIRCLEKERQALLTFRAGLTATYKRDIFPSRSPKNTSWSNKDCCKWSGVECSNQTGHVIKLDLSRGSFVLADEANPSLLILQELTYLDLTSIDFENRPLPRFFGSFTKLKFLDLAFCNFGGIIPSQLGNLSNLNYLRLSPDSDNGGNLSVDNIDWLSRLSSLQSLNMDGVDLSTATNWVDIIKSLPFLSTLILRNCQLSKVSSPSSLINSSSTSIKELNLDSNGFTSSSIHSWLFNLSSTLIDLSLSDNMLESPDLEAFADYMPSLQYLYLSSNLLQGMIPNSFGNLCNLVMLDMSNNSLSGNLSNFLDILFTSGCASPPTLESLFVDSNKLYGPLPDAIIRFSSLEKLFLSNNQLNGTLTKNMGTLSQLDYLDLSYNSLTGIVSEAHFSNLSRLTVLGLSLNPLHIKVSPQWFPRFQLNILRLRSCNLGPLFPNWIRTQKNFVHLDFSSNGISDSVPPWFWDISSQILYLNLSSNNFGGTLPDLSSMKHHGYPGYDLSSNNFEGPIPLFPSNLESINLSRNKFVGNLDFLCQLSDAALSFIDLSHNLLSGGFPDCMGKLKNLVVVNLAHNKLSGEIPYSIGLLSRLETLYLFNNTLSGKLPLSLSNCQQLRFLDIGENNLTGNVPAWIGANISQLYILSLRSNNFWDHPVEFMSVK